MDYLGGTASATLGVFGNSTASGPSGSLLECLIAGVVAIAVLRLEVARRPGGLPRLTSVSSGKSYKHLLLKYAPEASGLLCLVCMAAALRLASPDPSSKLEGAEKRAWLEITRQWPILLTGDSLLALQAMLRLLVFLSIAFRMRDGPVPLAREAAGIWLGAAVARTTLALKASEYLLDGPLGGYLPVACEFASVPLLAILSRGIPIHALPATALTLAACACLAVRNRLALSEDPTTDSLFAFAHCAELLAAFVYLFRALLLGGLNSGGKASVALHFAHVVLPLQQCLAAYYFIHAFEFAPGLVGTGHPFELLQGAGIAQLAAYAAAAVLYLAELMEESPGAPNDEPQVGELAQPVVA